MAKPNLITVVHGAEYRTSIQNIYDENEFFYPQYMQAAKCVDEITSEMYRYTNAVRTENIESATAEQDIMGYPNNIIGFCAKRGQGKSSAMLSFTNALATMVGDPDRDVSGRNNRNRRSTSDNRIKELWDKAHKKNLADNSYFSDEQCDDFTPVYQTKYHVLRTVDPTTMEHGESVLDIIIARLLQQAQSLRKKYLNEDQQREKDRKYHDLLEKFQKVYSQIRKMKCQKPADEYDDLANILEIGDSRNTKIAFVDMIHKFLDYVNADMLVIPVDDADLNPERAYEIVDDLRKYCMVPRVMILMAIHLGTLRTCIEQDYVIKYEKLLQSGIVTDHMEKYRCREMAERYIDKLIPGLHQVHLPYPDDKIRDGNWNLRLKYVVRDSSGKELRDILDFDNKIPATGDAQDEKRNYYFNRLARLLFEKTGVVLIEKTGYLHNFMPRRFRELTHFLAFLSKMTDIQVSSKHPLHELVYYAYYRKPILGETDSECDECIDRRIRNVDQLEMYFFQQWCQLVLTKNQYSKLDKIRTAPLSLKNKTTVEILKEYCREHEKELTKNLDYPDSHLNVTYSDVINLLSQVKKCLNTHFKFDFVYAIQMYYTIYMNKIVCLCLKNTARGFVDLTLLTGGTLYPVKGSEKLIAADVLNEVSHLIKPEELAHWFFPYSPKHPLTQAWKPDINFDGGSTLPRNIAWYVFKPMGFQFRDIDINTMSIQSGSDDTIEFDKDSVNRSKRIAASLYFIANFDLQYSAKKMIETSEREKASLDDEGNHMYINGVETDILKTLQGEVHDLPLIDEIQSITPTQMESRFIQSIVYSVIRRPLGVLTDFLDLCQAYNEAYHVQKQGTPDWSAPSAIAKQISEMQNDRFPAFKGAFKIPTQATFTTTKAERIAECTLPIQSNREEIEKLCYRIGYKAFLDDPNALKPFTTYRYTE